MRKLITYIIRFVVLIHFCFVNTTVLAQDTLVYHPTQRQDTTSSIQIVAMYTGDSVVLRWAPSNEAAWLQLSHTGYTVRRITLDKSGLPLHDTRRDWQVSPWTLAQFEKHKKQLSDYMLVAAQCLHGTYESASTKGINLHGYHQEVNNRFGLALLAADFDPAAAISLGWRYADTEVIPDALYLYEVHAADTSLHIRHAAVLLPARKLDLPVPVIDQIEEEEGHVVIKWKRAGHEEHFTAYQIEISEDGKVYREASTLPFLGGESTAYPSSYFSFRHALENYRPAYFRIKGITPFGTWSQPSVALRGQARDKTPTAALTSVQLNTDELTGIVRMTWKNPVDKDFAGTEIYRSISFDGTYGIVGQGVLKKSVQYFEETQPDTRAIYYYKLAAVDTAGNKQYTRVFQAAFRDTIAPVTPKDITGSVDSMGVVRLHWASNTESDLEGYQVYMANQADHIFTNMTPYPISDTLWQDTISLKTFTEEIYYRVAAVDFHSHVSTWSDPVRLIRPDTLRPMPPTFSGYRVEKDHIMLRMNPSRSKDIVSYEFRRRKSGDTTWKTIQNFDVSKGSYLDYDVIAGETYDYVMTSIDDAGLTCAQPAEISIRCVDRTKPIPPAIISCTLQEEHIHLAWEQPESGTKSIIVYRSVNGGLFTTVATLHDTMSYTDKTIQKNTTYAYKIKSTWQDGQRSGFSELATPFVR